MLDLSGPGIVLVALTYLAAGFVKGVTGMGLPIVAMAVLGNLMSPVTAAALLIAPSMVTNVWQLATGPDVGAIARRLWPMMLCVTAATIMSSYTMARSAPDWTLAALGAALAAYALLGLSTWRPAVPPDRETWLGPLVGLVGGAIAGFTGMFSIPAVPYLQALNLKKDDLVQALGMLFTVATVALGVGLQQAGVFDRAIVIASLCAIPPAMLGLWIGELVRRRIDAETFRRWFLICLLAMGVQLAARPLF